MGGASYRLSTGEPVHVPGPIRVTPFMAREMAHEARMARLIPATAVRGSLNIPTPRYELREDWSRSFFTKGRELETVRLRRAASHGTVGGRDA